MRNKLVNSLVHSAVSAFFIFLLVTLPAYYLIQLLNFRVHLKLILAIIWQIVCIAYILLAEIFQNFWRVLQSVKKLIEA